MSKQKKQVILLYVSTLIGTLLGVLSSIINTKFLAPEEYGDVRYVQNIINFIASLLLFGYFLSGSRLLALSSNETESQKIRGCMVCILCTASFILICATCLCSFIHREQIVLSNLFLLSIPVSIYPLLNNYINTTAQGDNHIGRLSTARLIPYLLYIPIAYFLYKTYGATSNLMMSLQWGIYTIVLIIVIISSKPRFKDLKNTFIKLNHENKKYGIQLYWGSLIMIGSNYIAGITLGVFDENNINVGFYTLALNITTPLAMLPGIIGTTYFKQFAKQSKIPYQVMNTTIYVSLLSCMIFILLIRIIVDFIYPDMYSLVGIYASWLAIGFSIHGFGDMINRYLGSHGQGKQIKKASIGCGSVKLIGFTFIVYYFGINGAILTNVASSIIYTILICCYYYKFIK